MILDVVSHVLDMCKKQRLVYLYCSSFFFGVIIVIIQTRFFRHWCLSAFSTEGKRLGMGINFPACILGYGYIQFQLQAENCTSGDFRRRPEFDLGGYKLHDIEFVLGQGDKTTTYKI